MQKLNKTIAWLGAIGKIYDIVKLWITYIEVDVSNFFIKQIIKGLCKIEDSYT